LRDVTIFETSLAEFSKGDCGSRKGCFVNDDDDDDDDDELKT
jgi:hypothetical protein